MTLKRLSRRELFSRLQILRTLEPIFEKTYEQVLRRDWRDQLSDSPHGHPWHTSFHASQFPGNDEKACARQSLYRMMDLPGEGPPSRRLHLTAQAGLAMEHDLVKTMHLGGILISAPPDADHQTGFVIPEAMLTGSVDSAIALRRRATPVEIKTKHESDIEQMRLGKRGPDAKHVKQLKTQMGLIRAAQESGELWSDLKLVDGGYVYYMPRDTKYAPGKPIPTAEFWVQYDAAFFDKGLERLAEWREFWDAETLPEEKPGKRTSKFGHPNGWKWSQDPCQFCSYKKTACQPDFRNGVTNMEDSHAIAAAKMVRPEYDYSEARARVKRRWKAEAAGNA